MITTKELLVGYRGHPILGPVNLCLPKGRMVGILGPNGSGKTTLLKTLAGILPRLEGTVLWESTPLEQLSPHQLAKALAVVLTGRISLENTSCFEVAAMGRSPHTGFFGVLSEADRAITRASLARCAADYLAERLFDQVSEGERQKVLLARGLAQDTPMLLLDEPTSHLDIKYKLELLSTLKGLAREGKTVVCTLHEPDLAVKCCDWLVLVQAGHILDQGPTHQVLARGQIQQIYGLQPHQLDLLVGTTEFLPAADGPLVLLPEWGEESLPLLRMATAMGATPVVLAAGEESLLARLAVDMGARLLIAPSPEQAVAVAAGCDLLCLPEGGPSPLSQRLERLGKPICRNREALATALEGPASTR